MDWYIVAAGVVGIFVLYKLATARTRKAANTVAGSLGVNRHFVDQMLGAMGAERGKMFVSTIASWGDKENHGAYTFVVYQIMKNDSEQNIKWWKLKLSENNIEPNMDYGTAETAFMYLRDAGANMGQIDEFLRVYNSVS
ncbi:DUF1198 family protein [Halomonas pacifica]|uniref:DUF1198 family protein n=1 Tax=Bisbaumannia pacifica TaxID=77098 RepID=UPI002358ED2F|nr:DUF1198 family protein [Halomonas pacifica]MDC8804060.1 DUF1198 family protein [Halomonas pacifica]